jgi:hypothetical protein
MNNIFTVETQNGLVEWKLDAECRRVVQPIADEFGMGVEQFLTLYTRHRLPAQLVRGNPVDENELPAGFSVTACEDPLIWNRARRCAQFAGQSVKEFVWQSIASGVNCAEEDMVLSPKTGNLIGHDCELETFIVRRELHEI